MPKPLESFSLLHGFIRKKNNFKKLIPQVSIFKAVLKLVNNLFPCDFSFPHTFIYPLLLFSRVHQNLLPVVCVDF